VSSFWETLPRPIIALSPMDGVTDAPYRKIHAEIGRPAITFTEFTNVQGLWRGDLRLLDAFLYDEAERPVVAQLFGSTPEDFYRATIMVCALGFDGVDINMGCPSKCVAGKGGGAGLIRTPLLAQEIIRQTKRATEDWYNGQTLEGIGLAPERIARIRQMNEARLCARSTGWRPAGTPALQERRLIPVSVKTRLGYDSVIIEDWVQVLLEMEPVNISLHGRTLRQMYTGQANWEAIGRAAAIVRQTKTTILGNGDLHTAEEVAQRMAETGVHGVLIGRGSMGNPWIFQEAQGDLAAHRPTPRERLTTALYHTRLFDRLLPGHRFVELRKHLSWYCRDFYDASTLRRQLVQSNAVSEVERLIEAKLAEPDFDERAGGASSPVDAFQELAQAG
jgi:tRNA-dihydrouridine synthase B